MLILLLRGRSSVIQPAEKFVFKKLGTHQPGSVATGTHQPGAQKIGSHQPGSNTTATEEDL